MVDVDDAALLQSVEREMRRRRRQLRVFLAFATTPLLVALGFLAFGREEVVDLEPLRAKVDSVDETLAGAKEQVGELSSALGELTGLEESVRAVEHERTWIKERLSGLDAKGIDLESRLLRVRQDQQEWAIETATELQRDLQERDEELRSLRGNFESLRKLASNGGHGDEAALQQLHDSLSREIDMLRQAIEDSKNRAGAHGKIVARVAPSADYPAHVRIDLEGAAKAFPGDTGVVRRRGRYCGLVTVIDVRGSAILATVQGETVGRNGVDDGDTIQFHVR